MNTIDRSTAYKQLVSKHNTMKWQTENGALTVRKTEGRYVVSLDDFHGSLTKKSFATLPGAMICADTLRTYFL